MVNGYSLKLRGIRFVGRFGATREERSRGQQILVDVDLDLPIEALPKHDRRKDVVDYDAIVRRVVEEGIAEPYRLLETYVVHLVARLFEDTPAMCIRAAATKARAPTTYPVDAAIVEVVRQRNETEARR